MSVSQFARRMFTAAFSRDRVSRYEARHDVLKGLAARSGFRLYNRNLAWMKDEEYLRAWSEFPEATGHVHERRFNLFNLARGISQIPGDLAECGVFHAAGSFLMLQATRHTQKKLYGFDSFEGLSEPGAEDQVSSDDAFRWQKHDMRVAERVARSNLSRFSDRIELFAGWIPESFHEVDDRSFCLVHIDVDLYQPTRDAAGFFYERLSPGGLLVCDDYGFETCPGARKAMDEVAEEAGTRVVHLTTGQGLLFRPA